MISVTRSAVAVLVVFGLMHAASAMDSARPYRHLSEAEFAQIEPRSANPYLAYLPAGVEPDYTYWDEWGYRKAQHRAELRRNAASMPVLNIGDIEPNNNIRQAQHIPTAGTGEGEDSDILISGNLTACVEAPVTLSDEEDGAIQFATPTNLVTHGCVTLRGVYGNGAHAETTGDVDFFQLGHLVKGQVVQMGGSFGNIRIYNVNGVALYENNLFWHDADDFIVPIDGDYFLAYANYNQWLSDPFDPSSGRGPDSGPGDYQFLLTILEQDVFSMDLQAGDVIGLKLTGLDSSNLEVGLLSPIGGLLIGSGQDLSFIYPDTSPLPGGGHAVAAYVAPHSGRYFVTVTASSESTSTNYQLEAMLRRPVLESEPPGTKQILFLDFNGATIDAESLFGSGNSSAGLSPLVNFVPAWGIPITDTGLLIDRIIARVEENLVEDMAAKGSNPRFALEVRNSRDHADPFGEPNVSRVIIGGTIDELGMRTLGIASSIDPGNMQTTDTAVVLLDLLSVTENDAPGNSLNSFPLAPGASKLEMVATAVGNIASHEAAHFFGSFHTDNSNFVESITNKGGNGTSDSAQLGPDGIYGTYDDPDVDVTGNTYSPREKFKGYEDVLNITAFGLSGPGITVCPKAPQEGCVAGERAALLIEAGKKLQWAWKGSLNVAAMGNPNVDQLLWCLYSSKGALHFTRTTPTVLSKVKVDRTVKYRDRSQSSYGLKQLKFKSSGLFKLQIGNTHLPQLPLENDSRVLTQATNGSTGYCIESELSGAIKTNDFEKFSATIRR